MFDFLGISKTLKNFAAELQTVRQNIEILTRQVEDIQYAPADQDDVLKALNVWATENADLYRAHLKRELSKLVLHPGVVGDKDAVRERLRYDSFFPDPRHPITRDVQMCGLLGPATFVDLVKDQMQWIEWPKAGLPMADRGPAIKVLEQQIAKLKAKEKDLLDSAEKAGLNIA